MVNDRMKITCLVENTSDFDTLQSEHGLSLYIETNKHKILFDTGASDLYLENARKLNIDLSEVDYAVISHGHNDHGGGLKTFLKVNSKALIYLNKYAFGPYYSKKSGGKSYIGLDQALCPNKRFIFAEDYLRIDEGHEIFSNIKGNKFTSKCNDNLVMKSGETFVADGFNHEQSLLIEEDGKSLLIAGCAHRGIVNIIDHITKIKNVSIDYVIGGFHLYSSSAKKSEDSYIVQQIGQHLKNTDAIYYTCHCTGLESYNSLKNIMQEKINYLSTGGIITI